MPLQNQPMSLKRASMTAIGRNFDKLCYGNPSRERMNELLNTEEYLLFEGPFSHMPCAVLEDMLEVLSGLRVLHRKHHHMLIQGQTENLNLSYSIGDSRHGLEIAIRRCKNLKRLNVSYLRHINPSSILRFVPSFTTLISLNLQMTLTVDEVLREIGKACSNLMELNLTATPITDLGLVQLCLGEEGQPLCQNLVRLIVSETSISIAGPMLVLLLLPKLKEFDYDHIFDVLLRLDEVDQELITRILMAAKVRLTGKPILPPPFLPLVTLISNAKYIPERGLEIASRMCPFTKIITLAYARVTNEALYRFMTMENLTSLSLTNSETLSLDFHEGVLPLLTANGRTIKSLILVNFTCIDIKAIGTACPDIQNLALSNIAEYEAVGQPNADLFNKLLALEVWSDPQADLNPQMIRQLLIYSPNITNILFKGCKVISDKLFAELLVENPMPKMSHLTLDMCHSITIQSLHRVLDADNDLTVLRIWSCLNINRLYKMEIDHRVKNENMDLYFDWFEYQD